MAAPAQQPSGRVGSLPPALLMALPCSVAAAAATCWLVGPVAPAPRPDAPLPAALERLEAQVAALIEELRARPAAAAASPTAPATAAARAATPDPAANTLLARAEASIQRLERALRALRSAPPGARPLPRLPANWAEIDRLHALHTSDGAAARRTYHLLTTAEVVERFGFPDRVENGSQSHLGDMYWTWLRRDRPGGEPDGLLTLYFRDGYVVRYETHRDGQ